jgi:hypothetical protein
VTPSSSHKKDVNRGLSPAYTVTVQTYHIVVPPFIILPFDSTVEEKRKCKSDNEAKESREVA